MDREYVSPEEIFAGQLWMSIGVNDGACIAENDFMAGKIIDFAACERDTKSGFVCDQNRQNDIAADFICGLYADGYTLVICVDLGGRRYNKNHEAENGKPKGDSIPDRVAVNLSAGLSNS